MLPFECVTAAGMECGQLAQACTGPFIGRQKDLLSRWAVDCQVFGVHHKVPPAMTCLAPALNAALAPFCSASVWSALSPSLMLTCWLYERPAGLAPPAAHAPGPPRSTPCSSPSLAWLPAGGAAGAGPPHAAHLHQQQHQAGPLPEPVPERGREAQGAPGAGASACARACSAAQGTGGKAQASPGSPGAAQGATSAGASASTCARACSTAQGAGGEAQVGPGSPGAAQGRRRCSSGSRRGLSAGREQG
jgi:hypothetical protein